MSMWTDREVVTLIKKVAALEKQVKALEEEAGKFFPLGTTDTVEVPPKLDKRTREWREWKQANP